MCVCVCVCVCWAQKKTYVHSCTLTSGELYLQYAHIKVERFSQEQTRHSQKRVDGMNKQLGRFTWDAPRWVCVCVCVWASTTFQWRNLRSKMCVCVCVWSHKSRFEKHAHPPRDRQSFGHILADAAAVGSYTCPRPLTQEVKVVWPLVWPRRGSVAETEREREWRFLTCQTERACKVDRLWCWLCFESIFSLQE